MLGDRLFSYFEYHGDDLASDLARMGADGLVEAHRRYQQPVQEAAPGEWWASMEQMCLME